MARMLESALAKWRETPKKERYLDYDPAARAGEIRRAAGRFPADGLALRVYTRDMPRKNVPDDWRKVAWNVDSLWFRKAEVAQMPPARRTKGAQHAWPRSLVERIVRHHFVDNARGQTNGYRPNQVRKAELTATVLKSDARHVTLRLEGASEAMTTSAWPKDGKVANLAGAGAYDRGVRTTFYGEARFEKKSGRFVSFELAALGERFGQTRYNFRQGDLDAAPIGFAIVLDAEDPGRKVAPAEFGAYGW